MTLIRNSSRSLLTKSQHCVAKKMKFSRIAQITADISYRGTRDEMGPVFFLDLRFICELYSLRFLFLTSWRTSRAGHAKIDSYRN